ncbi:MAG: diguanylate cyclase [Marinobacter sp.]|uniref:sensor domain-containing diguanylate cyclase n=1 Tax=Marinobacter sp. TaxID=50741 RepID=UPI00299D4580|nr:diguanylate cyclase [Marinobacter sp.]MDX1636153.1 diguanylate cyclase [Marinobacter sp.]
MSDAAAWWSGLPDDFLTWLIAGVALFLGTVLVILLVRHRRLKRQFHGLNLQAGSAARSLRNADRDLRTLFDQSAIAVMMLDRSTRNVLYANETALTAFGARTQEQLSSDVMQRPDAWGKPPFSLLDFENLFNRVGSSGLQMFEWQTLGKHQQPLWLESSLSLISFKGEQAVMFTGVNISSRKHAEKAERYRHQAMTSMAGDSGLHVTLDHLTHMAEVRLPGARCGIMVHDVERRRLRWAGGRSVPETFRERMDGLPVAYGSASSGTAVFIRGGVTSRDIRTDERWSGFREDAENAGIRACWSEPILGSGGEMLGSFDVYHGAPWSPGDQDIDALTDPVALASLALERHQVKGQLEQMVLSEQMVRRISTDLLTLDAHETDQGITRTLRALGEYFRADRVFLCQFEANSQQLAISHEWAGEDRPALRQKGKGKYPVAMIHLKKFMDDRSNLVLKAGQPVPPEMAFLTDLLALDRNESALLAGVKRDDRIAGVLVIQLTSAINPWTPQRTQTTELMANLFGSVLTRNELLHSLTYQAVHDQLTGLYNRHKIESFMDQEVARCARYGSTFSVIIFDLDHFKSINDRFGHNEGDAVLSDAAQLIKAGTRESEIAGRWGGEEFLVILPETPLDSAVLVAERLRESVASHRFSIPDRVTISVGVAAFLPGDTPHEVIQRADAALYSAKESGRNCVRSTF